MTSFDDKEFGKVTVRRFSRSKSMKASIAPTGELRISLPSYVPIFMAKRMISTSREDIRQLFATKQTLQIHDGMNIGKSHSLHIRQGSSYSLLRTKQMVILQLEDLTAISSKVVINDVRAKIIQILRREAKQHLPKRLAYIAETYGFTYTSVRFNHAGSRWGSCNQNKAINLNIALMNVPYELIDYVLIHELSHTKHLNHSKAFWEEVARADQLYELHRKQLKSYSPHI